MRLKNRLKKIDQTYFKYCEVQIPRLFNEMALQARSNYCREEQKIISEVMEYYLGHAEHPGDEAIELAKSIWKYIDKPLQEKVINTMQFAVRYEKGNPEMLTYVGGPLLEVNPAQESDFHENE